MKTYTVLYTGEDEQSHFREEELTYSKQYPELDNQIFRSQEFPAKCCKLWTVAADEEFVWVNAPCKQFIQVMSGRIEIEVGSGDKRTFGSGHLLWVEDCTGQGHITRVLEDVVALIVMCEDNV